MPNDPARGQGRPWKHQATAAERKQEAQAPWRREPARPSAGVPRWSKKAKLGLTALGFLVFCGVLIWAFTLLMPPRPACLVAFVAGYEENLSVPLNFSGPHAARELTALTQSGSDSWFWRSGLFHLKQPLQELRTDQAWDQNLEKFQEKTIFLFFGVHGGADRQGAYLLPHDSNGRDVEKNRLRLSDVLDRLANLPKDRNKVLILDATQITAYWPLGILHNDFARKLEELEPDIARIPNLIVLSASDVDQRSWVSEEWRTTVFSHFLIEGLKGAADQDGRGRINAGDLYQYVSNRVEQWVGANRDALQQPVLLPKGEAGLNLARKIDLVLVKERYQPPQPDEIPSVEDLSELRLAWSTFQRLEESVPSPGVYSPHLWRQYQEYLLRYEQLVRIGDKTGAEGLAKRLGEKEQELLRAQHLVLGSAENSLAMPAAAGLGSLSADQRATEFNQLWDAKPDEVSKVWDQILKTKGGTSRADLQRLRVELGVQLMKRAAEDPVRNLENAAQLARVIWKGSSLAPAEIQFLAILERDRPRDPRPASAYFDGVKKALTVRLLAEQTALAIPPKGHPYSEQVYPWIEEKVIAADKERLRGQDLLLASDRPSWEKALKYLQDAQNQYAEAREIANVMRDALEVRDLGFERLPSYSRWLARRRIPEDKLDNKADEDLLDRVEELWKNLHGLDQLLEKPEPAGAKQAPPANADDPQLRNLRAQTDLVRQDLGKLTNEFDQRCRALSDRRDLQDVWRDADDALVVPFIQPRLRMNLLSNIQSTARQLLGETTKKSRETHSVSSDENTLKAKESARRQGRLALAALGERTFDQDQEARLEKYGDVQTRLKELKVAEKWRESLTVAGDQAGRRWQYLPSESQRLLETGQKAEKNPARTSLQTADCFTRLMDAGTGLALADNPVAEYRRLLMQGLLGWQAQRTWEDHLFDLNPKAEQPYYQQVGKLYLDDARAQNPSKLRQKTFEPIQQKLDARGDLVADGQPRWNITSEQRFKLEYQIHRAKDAQVPAGFPVIGVEIGNDLELKNMTKSDRQVLEVGGDAGTQPFVVSISSPRIDEAEKDPPPILVPKRFPSRVTVVGHYRGQRIERETPVDLYPLPEIAQIQPQVPDRASLAIRADPAIHDEFGVSNGNIVFILDCSGSMNAEQPGGTTRFQEATKALEKTLRTIPKGATVSLWVFAQKQGNALEAKDVEKTIKRLHQKPMVWDPEKPRQLQELMDQVKGLEPWNATPLVRSMMEARRDFEAAPGFKTMIILTDGMDTRFEKGRFPGVPDPSDGDPIYNPKGNLKIADFLPKAFQNSGIDIKLVGFQLEKNERKQFQEQFKEPIEKLGGNVYQVEKPDQLMAALRKSLKQDLRYLLEEENDSRVLGLPPEGFGVSRTADTDQWAKLLRPRDYYVRVQTNELNKRRISLDRGDLLLLQLSKTSLGIDFKRLLYAEADHPFKPSKKTQGWRLAVLQNQKRGERGLGMFVALEREAQSDAPTLRQAKPTAVWIEIRPPADVKESFGVRWKTEYGYPGPSWSFDVAQWPSSPEGQGKELAPPTVHAWWSDQVPESASLKGSSFNNQIVPLKGDQIIVESLEFEDHRVETRPGHKEMQHCLVVRLGQVKDKPYWVKLNGIKPAGEEHRFYKEAGKYTGLFWPVTKDQAVEELTGLSLFSLNDFKQEAERRKLSLEMPLPEPKANDDRPRRPRFPLTDEK
jgi:Mg-chelatase subunit ChlD